MKKIFCVIAVVALLFGVASCKKDANVKEKDEKQEQIDNLNEFLDIVAVCMDSINGQEHGIFYSKDGMPLSNKEQIRENLKLFKNTVDKQHQRIAELEKALESSSKDDGQTQKLQEIIASLKSMLEEKDAIIAKLERELSQKDVNIAQLNQEVNSLNTTVSKQSTHISNLNQHVSTLNTQVEQLDEQNQKQQSKIEEQQKRMDELNVGYVKVGTKDELVSLGILKGSGLAKKKFNASGVNNAHFQQVSTSSATTIAIPGKKPEIMTQHPAGSYTLTSNALTITDPYKFWSVSHYLVIKHK